MFGNHPSRVPSRGGEDHKTHELWEVSLQVESVVWLRESLQFSGLLKILRVRQVSGLAVRTSIGILVSLIRPPGSGSHFQFPVNVDPRRQRGRVQALAFPAVYTGDLY